MAEDTARTSSVGSSLAASGRPRCGCTAPGHPPHLVALTGGPGAGKTAALEVIRRTFCEHVVVLPEAATILFGGGFPRIASEIGRRAGQRAIFRIQRELEQMAIEEARAAVVLCDRGTLDGLAYWPGDAPSFWAANQTTQEAERARYAAVIHLRTPSLANGYNHENPVRTESVVDAARIDAAIAEAWDGHPRRTFVEATPDFLAKVARIVELVRAEVPRCCQAATASQPTLAQEMSA